MKTVLDFLHGNWLKHPLHALLVHLPTGLWPAALLFDVLSRLGVGGGAMVQTSFYAIALGLVGALLAIPPGLADWSDIGRDKPAWKIGLYHMALNAVAVVVWAINLILRWGMPADAATVPAAPLALSVLGTLILCVSGYLGGRMVYGYGTYVGWFQIAKWRRIAEAGGARVPSEEKG